MSTYITTYTGKHIHPTDPDPEGICIEDIAHALSYLCRGNGHVASFWSVAQHCICCAKEARARGLSNRLVLACLLHDAAECYLSDVPRPFKKLLPHYREYEDRILTLIYEKYLGSDLKQEEKEIVREIDNAFLWYDLKVLLKEETEEEKPKLYVQPDYTVLPFANVEAQYLALYKECMEMNQPTEMQQILVVVDMQNDFIDGALGTEEARLIVPLVREKIKNFSGTVYFTRDTHPDNYLQTQEGKNLPVPHCIKGTKGWEIHPDLDKLRKTRPIDKATFGSLELGEILKEENQARQIRSITFVGLCTDICVISNAMIAKAALPETLIRVDAKCCAGVSPKSHQVALEAMKMCQIQIDGEA